ncbi:MAG: argininosuccinate lyase [Candidatus Margulisiibacteriota bacterium]|jgi:argininosuccinate lyase
MTKLWGGRFNKELDPEAKKFSYSLHIDKNLFEYDLKLNLAYSKALLKINILTHNEFSELEKEIFTLIKLYKENKIDFANAPDEDVHSLVERLLTEKLGDLGKKIHTGKSRNDQVITDTKMFLKDEITKICQLIIELQKVIHNIAVKEIDLIFIGFTHFQPAQPILFSHYLLSYYEMLNRDIERLQENFMRADVCPLGSAALAGSNYQLDREQIAKELGFSQLSQNSIDAVSDRDFMIESLNNLALIMIHLSRMAEELILYSSPLINFFELDDNFTTGSSIMPQKKNPDIAELIRGKTAKNISNLNGLLVLLKGLPLAYNRDLQEDKIYLFESIENTKIALNCMTKMLAGLKLNKSAIESALKKGYLLATELADYLVLKGIPFRAAHELTGQLVVYAINKNKNLEDLSLAEFTQFVPEIEADIFESLNYENAIKNKNILGGTNKNQVQSQLNKIAKRFKNL